MENSFYHADGIGFHTEEKEKKQIQIKYDRLVKENQRLRELNQKMLAKVKTLSNVLNEFIKDNNF